jgi:MFS family permease
VNVTTQKSLQPAVYLQISNFFSGVSNAVVMITIPWLVLEVTGSPFFAGLVVAVSALPSLIVAPFGGVLIARFGSKGISVFADLMSVLSVVAFPVLAITGNLSAFSITVVALLGAVFDPLGYTARKTMIQPASQVGRIDVDRLNGIHEGLFGASWVIGPALGAGLIAVVGAVNSFWVVGALLLIAALAILLMKKSHLPRITPPSTDKATSGFSGITLGFKRIWQDRFLRAIMLAELVLGAIYLPTESVILPTYFEALGRPLELGLVITVLAAGSTISAFAYGWVVKRLGGKLLIRIAFVGASLGTLGMAFLPPFWLLLTFALILGLAFGPFYPYLNSKIQSRFPSHEHPMVFSAQTSIFYAAPPLGTLLVGLALEGFGVSLTYLIVACVMLAVSVLALFSKHIRAEG